MEKAKRIDVCSRFFFPAVFAVFNVAYWFNYLLQARQEFLKTQKRMNEWAKKNNNNWKQNDSKLDYQKAKIILYMNSKKTPACKRLFKIFGILWNTSKIIILDISIFVLFFGRNLWIRATLQLRIYYNILLKAQENFCDH